MKYNLFKSIKAYNYLVISSTNFIGAVQNDVTDYGGKLHVQHVSYKLQAPNLQS